MYGIDTLRFKIPNQTPGRIEMPIQDFNKILTSHMKSKMTILTSHTKSKMTILTSHMKSKMTILTSHMTSKMTSSLPTR